MKRLILVIKALLVLIVALGIFVYGILVGNRQIFPFPLLQSARSTIIHSFRGKTDTQAGEHLFADLCSQCHGIDGSGGEGPPLNRTMLPRAQTDDALRRIIESGIGAMPPVRQTTEAERRQIVTFLRTLSPMESPPSSGNVEVGQEVYTRMKCDACHVIDGQGNGFGPELTNIGLMRSSDYLRTSIESPELSLPSGTLEVSRGYTEFLPVRVITRSGQIVSGVRINEDSFTIQVRDRNNAVHSFRKLEITNLIKETDSSVMPSYRDSLSETEMDDLVAFLSSLNRTQVR